MNDDIATVPTENQDLSELFQIRRDKLNSLQEEGRDPFKITKFNRSAFTKDIHDNFEAMENTEVSIAGRVMAKRQMGKAIFLDISDDKGRIQVYLNQKAVCEQSFGDILKGDIGDIIGVSGTVFKTKMGEVSVRGSDVVLMAKSLRPLPEKFHGLIDVEQRYRRRYLDLIMNQDVRKNFEIRSRFIKHLRAYLDNRGYMEVETPVLNTISGGAVARPFMTHHNTLDLDMYLRIAPELHLKRLVVGGIERVYEIGRVFRNEGMSPRHNPEYTMAELYEAYADYHDLMDIFENVLSSAALEICGSYELSWLDKKLDLSPGWDRVSMADAVKVHTGVDFMSFDSVDDAVKQAKSIGVKMPDGVSPSWGGLLFECFDQRVEEKLVEPVFITDHPVEVSPLAKKKSSDPRLTDRFELFICSSEMGNGFSELNDPIDQKERFLRQAALRDAGDEEAGMMDDDYIDALEYGLPPTGGLGIGIDRCVMMLTNSSSIRDIILFPTMKPL